MPRCLETASTILSVKFLWLLEPLVARAEDAHVFWKKINARGHLIKRGYHHYIAVFSAEIISGLS